MIRSTGIEIEGKNAVVVGRSDIVVGTIFGVFLFESVVKKTAKGRGSHFCLLTIFFRAPLHSTC